MKANKTIVIAAKKGYNFYKEVCRPKWNKALVGELCIHGVVKDFGSVIFKQTNTIPPR